MKAKLLASAPNEADIKKLIARYWFSAPERIMIDSDGVYNNGKLIDGFQVRQVKGRYRFEYIGDLP